MGAEPGHEHQAPGSDALGRLASIGAITIDVLLIPRGWKNVGAFSPTFWVTMAFLVVWWGMMFAATGWIFAKAPSSPPIQVLPAQVGTQIAVDDSSPFAALVEL
jgi:hypothetical protein